MKLLALIVALPLAAQWTNLPPEPKVASNAKAPMLAGGVPDLSGVWQAASAKWLRNLYDKPEELSFTPAGRAIFDRRKSGELSKFEPDANCLPQGVPKINATPVPFRMFQMKDRVVIVYEAFNLWRQVFLDGRKPVKEPNPTWLGYSTGKYDKDTLVVTTVGFNGKTWLDMAGLPLGEKGTVTERFHRRDYSHLDIAVTIDDPEYYTKPWSATQEMALQPGTELFEFICNENERDQVHIAK